MNQPHQICSRILDSKLGCLMCNRCSQSYGRFARRGCHGRLFKRWTVDAFLPGQADRTAMALVLVQKEVKKRLKASIESHIQLSTSKVLLLEKAVF